MKVKMFDTKLEVDRHVERCLRKINNETERNLKCLAFARLYFKVGAYEHARRYVSAYLSVKPLSAEALLLHGKCLEKQGKLDAAIDAYRKSLEIDPHQNNLVLKVCELLSVDDVVNDLSGAHYFCEMAHSLDPHNPAVFNLKERLVTAESQDPEDITKLLLNELEARPTDVKLHVRYLRHLIQTNKVLEAYMHTVEMEQNDKFCLLNNLKWYETISEVLLRYQKDNSSQLTWEFWSLLGSTLDRLACLTLDEHLNSTSDCVAVVFNFDQTLNVIIKNLSNFNERSYVKEFVSHYRAQLCFHLATLLLKQAKKDLIKYKDAMTIGLLPLLFASYHTQPAELRSIWLNHTSEIQKLQIQRWHKEAAYRCSQTGHILLGAANDTKGSLIEKAMQNCTGIWRENLYKRLFVTRYQQTKMQSSTFVTDDYFLDIQFRLPDDKELEMYDQTAQLIYPDSLHHSTWICMNQKPPLFKCTIFDGLQYSVKNLNNCAAETLNVLDIEAFLYCTAFTAQQVLEQRKNQLLYNTDKPNVLPAAITPLLGTLNQANWWTSAYKMYKNEHGSNMSEVRLCLISGIEVVRCIGNHGLDVKLLIMLARIFAERANSSNKQSEIEFNNARAELYWKAALPLLDKLQKHCAIMYPVNRLFEYKSKEFTSSEIIEFIEEGKLFNGTQLMKKMEHDRAIKVFETLRSPYASFNQAQIYKTLADELSSQENITSEMRSRQIILLSKSRDCLYLTLDRLRDPSVDSRHPLNAQLGNNIEQIEKLLNTLDPDNSNHRNECDGMSDENISVADSIGDYIYNINSFNSGRNEFHTPLHDRSLNSTRNRTELSLLKEARPSPERLDAQIRRMQATRDVAVTNILEQTRIMGDSHRSLIKEMKNMRQAITNLTGVVQSTCEEFNDIQETMKNTLDEVHSFREVSELVKELKKEIADLKKDGGKPKNNQLNDEDLYVLDEEYGNDYVLNANMPNFNAGNLYQNYQPRMPAANTLNYPPAALYPGLYPLYPYANLGLAQAGALPFGQDQIPDYRALNPLSQSLPQANFSQPKSAWDMGGIVQPNLSQFNLLPQQPPLNIPPPPQLSQAQTDIFKDVVISTSNTSTSLNTTTTQFSQSHSGISKDSILQTSIFSSTAPSSKAPANVVITSSDPLPKATVQTTQVLSVTIPPQHIKENQLQKSRPHNYQIPLPTTTTSIFTTTPSLIMQPSVIVSTHSLLSSVSAPVYSSIEKSPLKNTTLGVQIDESLRQVSDNCQNSNLNNSNTSSTPIREHDPCPDFMPVIPLPDEVPVNTGEENEIILFSKRVKLFRYANKEWKERGVGTLKILRNKDTGKCRILMRRDQVHKICANHFLTKDMLLTQMPNNTRAYSWAAHDYADEQMVVEKLCARFKTEEEASAFCRAFEKAKEDIVTEANTSLGGFIFTSTPTFKPKDKTLVPNITVKEDVKASPFAYFSFGIGSTPIIDIKTVKEDKCDTKPEKPKEENMEILFESGAKLLQFDLTNKEWKQKGTGIMKLLKGNTIRLVMRQEQDHSVCCDHQLLKTMQFTKMANNSKGLTWKVGSDLNAEMFGVKFKSEEQSEAFYKAVTSAQDLLNKHDCSASDQKVPIPEIISLEFKDQSKCKEDKKVKSEAKVESQKLSGWGDKFKVKLGHWECKNCYVFNEAKCHYCIACDTPKSNASPKKPSDTQFSFGVNLTSASTVDVTQKSQFTFGNTPTSVTSTSTTSSWGDAFKPKANSWECQQCLIRNDGNVLYCAACDSPKDDSVPKKETAKAGVSLETPGLQFSFGIAPKETKEIKGETKQAGDDVGVSSTKESTSESSAPQYNFGIPSDTISKANSTFTLSLSDNITTSKPFVFSIGTKEADNGKKDSFVFGSPQKATFEFTPRSPRRHSSGCQGDEEGEGYVEDEGEHIYFKPVIPLPDKVEVRTGEEQEEVLYCHYAKLYRFVQGEWKERGIGDVKILLKCDTGRLRVIMRRDQVLKICLNHILTADIQYLKKDEKTWLFSVHDFSEGELSDSRFCLRFKSSSVAEEFRKAIEDALKKSKECLDATSSTSKDINTLDVEFVSEAQVTPEEEAEAVNLKLPPKFMAYRQLPDCTCDMCKKDDEFLSELFKKLPPKPEEQQTTILSDSNMLFGMPCKPFAPSVTNDKFIFGQPLKSDIFESAASIEKPSTLREMLVKPSILGSIETSLSKQGSENTKTAAIASSPALKNFSFTISNSATPSKDNLFKTVTSTSSSTFGSSMPGNLFANPLVPTTLVNIFGGNTEKSLFTTSSTIFGNTNNVETTKTDGESKKEAEELVLKCDPGLSFANLAASNKPAAFASPASGDNSKPFAFLGLGKPVFAKQVIQKKDTDHDKSETNEEAEGSDGEAEEYDPHYEPVISLPEAIVVTTGEEDEVVLFNERAKLYRFDNQLKEWKERGVGQMKILHHSTNGTYRFLLRREQVHKVVLNMLITSSIDLQPLSTSTSSWLWYGHNHTEDETALEKLAVRFKSEELAGRFYSAVQQAVCDIKETQESRDLPSTIQNYGIEQESDTVQENDTIQEIEGNEEDEDDDDDDDDKTIMFLKPCKLSEQLETGEWIVSGTGQLQLYYDSNIYGSRISVVTEDGNILSNTLIGINTEMTVQGDSCFWKAVEWGETPPRWRMLKATFISEEDAINLHYNYLESVQFAHESDLVDEIIVENSDSDEN